MCQETGATDTAYAFAYEGRKALEHELARVATEPDRQLWRDRDGTGLARQPPFGRRDPGGLVGAPVALRSAVAPV